MKSKIWHLQKEEFQNLTFSLLLSLFTDIQTEYDDDDYSEKKNIYEKALI